MWNNVKLLKDTAEDWLRTEEQEAHRWGATDFSAIGTKSSERTPVPYFGLLRGRVSAIRPALAKALPEEPQFAILTALAVAGPEHLWRENELPQLIELTKAMAKDLDRYYHPVGNTRSREDAALDFTVAWLLQGACPAPRAYQLVEIDVLGTIELILKWLSAEVPNFAESAGDAGTLAGAVLDLLFGWPHAPCPCCLAAVKALEKRAAKREEYFDIDFQTGLLPQALFYKRHEQRSNEEKRIINCFCFHRFLAYLKHYLLSRLALAQFLRQSVRGSYAEINGAFLARGMVYPLLTQKYSLVEVNVACRQCEKCTNAKKDPVKKWHDANCSDGKEVTECDKCKAKYTNATCYSWDLKQCPNCGTSFEAHHRIEAKRMHIIASDAGRFKRFETHTCMKCGMLYKAVHCKPSAGNHAGYEAPHDRCPDCATPHRAAPTPEDPKPSQRSFRTSEVYWFEQSSEPPSAANTVAARPQAAVPPATAVEARKLAIKHANEAGWGPWAIELIEFTPVHPGGSFRIDCLPPEPELQPLLTKWKAIDGAPKSYAELCERWYDLVAEARTSDAHPEWRQMSRKDYQRSQENPPE